MNEEDNMDGLAAEYVLGSLDPSERRLVNAHCKRDKSLADAIQAWQRRLASLSDQGPEVAPPLHLFDRVLTRISELGTQPVPIARRRHSARWTPFAIGAGALAACFALVVAGFIYRTLVAEPHPEDARATTEHVRMDCGSLYKAFWQTFDREKIPSISAMRLAGTSRMALRAYDACEAGDELDAEAIFEKLRKMQF